MVQSWKWHPPPRREVSHQTEHCRPAGGSRVWGKNWGSCVCWQTPLSSPGEDVKSKIVGQENVLLRNLSYKQHWKQTQVSAELPWGLGSIFFPLSPPSELDTVPINLLFRLYSPVLSGWILPLCLCAFLWIPPSTLSCTGQNKNQQSRKLQIEWKQFKPTQGFLLKPQLNNLVAWR